MFQFLLIDKVRSANCAHVRDITVDNSTATATFSLILALIFTLKLASIISSLEDM